MRVRRHLYGIETRVVITPVLTLVILVDQGIHNLPTWAEAKDEIREIFAKDHFPDIEAEIYVPNKRFFVPIIFPLQPYVEAIARYQAKQDWLLECLKENLPTHWNAISVFGFGSSKAKSRPALVVFVRSHAIQNWNRVAHRFGAIIDNPYYEIEFHLWQCIKNASHAFGKTISVLELLVWAQVLA